MAPPSLPPAAVLADYAYGFAKGKVIYAGVESGLLDVFGRKGDIHNQTSEYYPYILLWSIHSSLILIP